MLVETLISQGWLGGCHEYVRTNEDLALGTMGYTTAMDDLTPEFISFGDSHESLVQLPGIHVRSYTYHKLNAADETTVVGDTCNRYAKSILMSFILI